MSEKDLFEQAELLLKHFDFAAQLAAKEAQHQGQLREILLSFVEVMDSFDRLFYGMGEITELTLEQSHNCLKSCRLIQQQLDQALHNAGVTPLSSLGQLAEPGQHEIVAIKKAPGREADTVMQELFRGYKWNGELLRKPKVIVVQGED
ncbi:MAG: nucleotide exchange factor GrpE [Acidobacteriota bacterium]